MSSQPSSNEIILALKRKWAEINQAAYRNESWPMPELINFKCQDANCEYSLNQLQKKKWDRAFRNEKSKVIRVNIDKNNGRYLVLMRVCYIERKRESKGNARLFSNRVKSAIDRLNKFQNDLEIELLSFIFDDNYLYCVLRDLQKIDSRAPRKQGETVNYDHNTNINILLSKYAGSSSLQSKNHKMYHEHPRDQTTSPNFKPKVYESIRNKVGNFEKYRDGLSQSEVDVTIEGKKFHFSHKDCVDECRICSDHDHGHIHTETHPDMHDHSHGHSHSHGHGHSHSHGHGHSHSHSHGHSGNNRSHSTIGHSLEPKDNHNHGHGHSHSHHGHAHGPNNPHGGNVLKNHTMLLDSTNRNSESYGVIKNGRQFLIKKVKLSDGDRKENDNFQGEYLSEENFEEDKPIVWDDAGSDTPSPRSSVNSSEGNKHKSRFSLDEAILGRLELGEEEKKARERRDVLAYFIHDDCLYMVFNTIVMTLGALKKSIEKQPTMQVPESLLIHIFKCIYKKIFQYWEKYRVTHNNINIDTIQLVLGSNKNVYFDLSNFSAAKVWNSAEYSSRLGGDRSYWRSVRF